MKKKLIFVSIILILMILQSLPIIVLNDIGMKELEGSHVNIHYDKGDEEGARIVFNELEDNALEIQKKLNISSNTPTDVYVYKSQKSLHIRKYGLIMLLVNLEWYIGDNRGRDVLILSPTTKISAHDQESIISAATHEFVHTINYQINPHLSYFLDNGVATYLSNQVPERDFVDYNTIPPIDYFDIRNQVKFADTGGYQYSYTYIEFLDKNYGWVSILALLQGNQSYASIFMKSEMEIYDEWVEFLGSYY